MISNWLSVWLYCLIGSGLTLQRLPNLTNVWISNRWLKPVSFKTNSVKTRSTAASLKGAAVLARSSRSYLDAVRFKWNGIESCISLNLLERKPPLFSQRGLNFGNLTLMTIVQFQTIMILCLLCLKLDRHLLPKRFQDLDGAHIMSFLSYQYFVR